MPANIPNMAAVNTMGAQFKNNIFEGFAKKSLRQGRILGRIASNQTATPASAAPAGPTVTVGTPTRMAPGNTVGPGSPARGLGASPSTSAPRGLPTGQTRAPQGGFAPSHRSGTTPSSVLSSQLAIGSGRKPIATPYQAPARVIPMSGNAALTNRVNPNVAFSAPAQTQVALNRTQFNAPSATPFTPTSSSPVRTQSTPAIRPQQFSNVTTQSNAPFPTHQHPSGSSSMILPKLTAAQPKPNEFTVGSRSIKGGGIAAMGSQLEAGLMRRPLGTPAKKEG